MFDALLGVDGVVVVVVGVSTMGGFGGEAQETNRPMNARTRLRLVPAMPQVERDTEAEDRAVGKRVDGAFTTEFHAKDWPTQQRI